MIFVIIDIAATSFVLDAINPDPIKYLFYVDFGSVYSVLLCSY